MLCCYFLGLRCEKGPGVSDYRGNVASYELDSFGHGRYWVGRYALKIRWNMMCRYKGLVLGWNGGLTNGAVLSLSGRTLSGGLPLPACLINI